MAGQGSVYLQVKIVLVGVSTADYACKFIKDSNCICFMGSQLGLVPTPGPRSDDSKACAAEAVRALLSPAAEGIGALSSGLHHWSTARSGGGTGGLRQVRSVSGICVRPRKSAFKQFKPTALASFILAFYYGM